MRTPAPGSGFANIATDCGKKERASARLKTASPLPTSVGFTSQQILFYQIGAESTNFPT
jgi:hypothetical protein